MYPRSTAVALSTSAPVEKTTVFFAIVLLAGALLFGGVSTARAQETRVLTFNDAVRIALDRNVELQKARNNVEAEATTVAKERADFLPDLNLQAGPSRSYGLNFDQTSGALTQQSSTSFSVGAGSGVNLFNGFADVASLRQARHTYDATESTYDRTRQTVLFDVIQSYLEVLLDQEQVEILEEDVEAQRRQLEQIDEFVRVGARPISDLYQQQATLASSELQLLEQRQALQLSEARVIQVLELDPFVAYQFEAPATEELSLEAESFDLEAMLRRALTERADLRAHEFQIEAAEEGVRVARSGYLPSIGLNARFGTDYSSNLRRPPLEGADPFAAEPVSFGNQLTDNRSGYLSFGVSVPIFNRFQVKNAVERARVTHRNAELDLQNLRQGVALEVRQAYLDYQTAVKRLDVTRIQLQAARQALEAEQERYNVGAATLVELTQARANFVSAASARAQAVYRFVFQDQVIEYHMGTLDPSQPLF